MNKVSKILTKKLFGLLLTLVVSVAALFFFFGSEVKHPNSTYFSIHGDGMQNYYGHMYHIKYDSSYLRSNGMNYPYGEMVYYTGIQLVPASVVMFVSNNIVDISDYMLGIQNMFMLLSIVLAALLLFLILTEFGLPAIIASISGVCIAFLSPQLDRFGGHLSLTYVFSVPLIIYLIVRFYKRNTIFISLLICLHSFWAFTTHPYLFGMNAALLLIFWLFVFFKHKTDWRKNLLNFFIQFILPYILIQSLTWISDSATDRTAAPWGFLVFRAFPEGVFLPFGRPYGVFLDYLFPKRGYIEWEGVAYVGLIGLFAFILVLRKWGISIKRKSFSEFLYPNNNELLDFLFWGAFAALLYSFGIPFILGLEWLVNYSGPLKQMRGIGRFTWPFFYIINILAIYIIWNLLSKHKLKWLFVLPLALLAYDAWYNARWREEMYDNKFSALDDKENILPENEWTKHINAAAYQAVIPVPYFHLGSENIWISPRCKELENTLMVCLKTGLPTTGIYMSRTSISESFNNIQVATELYREPAFLKDCKNKKPFLLLVHPCEATTNAEKSLISLGQLLYKTEQFDFYELPFEKLQHASDSLYYRAKSELDTTKTYKHGNYLSTSFANDFISINYDSLNVAETNYLGSSGLSIQVNKFVALYEGSIPNCDTSKIYNLSFWFANAYKDLNLRTNLIISQFDSVGNKEKEDWQNIGNLVKCFDGSWVLLESQFKLTKPNNKIQITLYTNLIKKGNQSIDELLIRPENTIVYKEIKNGLVRNNRYYKRQF